MSKCMKLFGIFLMFIFIGVACSDDDKEENNDLTGKYEYEKFQFAFEYKGDTIILPDFGSLIPIPGMELPQLPSLPAKEIQQLVNGLGQQAMATNFKNIEFKDDNEFNLQFVAKETNMEIGGKYEATNNAIKLTLDNKKLQQLLDIDGLEIPTITFNYTLNEGNLIMVLNWNNLSSSLQEFMSTAAFTELVKELLADINPALASDMVINLLKAYLQNSILNNIEKLEGTFTLKKAS